MTNVLCGALIPPPTPTPTPTPTPLLHHDFEVCPDGWTFKGTINPFDTPGSLAESGVLGLTPAGSVNCFSYWENYSIITSSAAKYRARFTVGSTVSNSDDSVSFRLRATHQETWLSWNRTVNSYNCASPHLGVNKDYDLYIAPTAKPVVTSKVGPSLLLSFDIMSFNPDDDCNCYVFLDEIVVQEVGWMDPAVMTYWTFGTGSEGWQFKGGIPGFDQAGYDSSGGQLTLNPLGSANCFSYWLSPDVSVEQDKVYICQFVMSSSVASSWDAVQFRMRVNQPSNWQAWEHIIPSTTIYSPVSGSDKSYDLVFAPLMGTLSDNVQLCFDIMSFNPDDNTNSSLYLKAAAVLRPDVSP